MAVNIEVDEPEIDIRVRTYDGYVEATGISAPLVVGDAQVGKGAVVDVGPVTTALLVGDAETTKGDAVEGGASTALVTGDGQTDKGSAVSAGGTSAQTVVGDAETDKGEVTQAEGASAPLAVGNAQAEHLKPSYRWQMPLPRNLLNDPESFDPASTAWEFRNSDTIYQGIVDNVGPNGGPAYHFEFTTNDWLENQSGPGGAGLVTAGLFIRSTSGSFSFELKNRKNGVIDNPGNTYTVDTSWGWVTVSDFVESGAKNSGPGIQSDESGGIYLLRAGLNRGSSLHYTTDQSVSQTIPEVIQGADLQNGSSGGPDTNDLDFGVDEDGVPYAVSDGDDRTERIAASQLGSATWGFRFYLNHPTATSGYITGHRSRHYFGVWQKTGGKDHLKVFLREDDGTGHDVQFNNVGAPRWAALTVTINLDEGWLRANLDGTTKELTFDETNLTPLDWSPLKPQGSGQRGSHIERHPVLSEAEAEAVRQRLASNPPDPVPPTEAWDLSAETSPHNYMKYSEDGSSINSIRDVTITTDVGVDSSGATTMDRMEENTNTGTHEVVANVAVSTNGGASTITAEVREEDNRWVALGFFNNTDGTLKSVWQWFDLTNNQLGSSDSLITDADITELGNGLQRISAQTTPDNKVTNARIALADSDGVISYTGDGSSSVQFGRFQVCRGPQLFPPYVKTSASIAFPQTAPALRDSSNDLTLGSSSGADTNDPDWVAPIGLVGDGSDDYLLQDPSPIAKADKFTLFARIQSSGDSDEYGVIASTWARPITGDEIGFILSENNGDKLRVVLDFSYLGGTFTQFSSGFPVVFDGNPHIISLIVDIPNGELRVAKDENSSVTKNFDAQGYSFANNPRDSMSFMGGLRDGLPGKITHASYATRALSDEEALYARQRILDNPNEPFPTYTNA